MPTLILFLFRFGATPLQRSCGRRGGECGAPPSTRGLPAKTETTLSDFPRPTILGRTLPAVEALALSPDLRPGRYRRPLAARAISQVLGTSFQKEPATSRQACDGSRDSTSDGWDGCGQSAMGRTEDSRRAEDAWPRDLGTDHLPASAEVAATAQPDLEDLPAQPPWSNGLDGLFTVPTITMKVLFVFIVLEHRR